MPLQIYMVVIIHQVGRGRHYLLLELIEALRLRYRQRASQRVYYPPPAHWWNSRCYVVNSTSLYSEGFLIVGGICGLIAPVVRWRSTTFMGHFILENEGLWAVTIALQALSLVEKAEPVHVRNTTLEGRMEYGIMQHGCKVYMDSYTASNGSWFMVTWSILKNHLLEVGSTQNHEIMALPNLTAVGLKHFIMCEDLTWKRTHWNNVGLRV